MKSQFWKCLFFALAFLLSGCAKNSSDPTAEPLAVADQASLMATLDFAGATVGARESVCHNGGVIGTCVDAPRFYKTGRIIVIYIGSDAAVMNYLKDG